MLTLHVQRAFNCFHLFISFFLAPRKQKALETAARKAAAAKKERGGDDDEDDAKMVIEIPSSSEEEGKLDAHFI